MTPAIDATESAGAQIEQESSVSEKYSCYCIDGDISVTMMYAEQSLRDYNEAAGRGLCNPLFFQDDKLVLVSPDDNNNLTIKPVDAGKLTVLLTRCGSWKGGKRASKDKGGYPPQDIVRVILSAGYDTLNSNAGSSDLPLAVPILKGIHTGVLLDKNWNIIHTKGYNAETKLYLTNSYEVDPVPETVTEDDVQESKELLWNIYKEFLFSDADKKQESVNYQNTIAALATAIVRPIWEGVLPIYLVDKSNSGTGGSLLQEITSMLAFGVKKSNLKKIEFPEKGSTNEYEKTIKSALIEKRQYYLIDNVTRGAVWAIEIVLSHVTGCGNISFRRLGKSDEIFRGPSLYMVNGINLKMTPIDVTRRIIPVRIVSKKSLSELSGYFTRTKEGLYQLAEEMHPKVIRAFAIFRKNWIQKGKPAPTECTGNISEYQEWYNEIVGMLNAAGYTHILDNLKDIQTTDNDDETEAADFIRALKMIDEDIPHEFTPSELLDVIRREVINCKPADGRCGSEISNQTILPHLKGEIAQKALTGQLTPDMLGKVLSGMKDMKLTGCDYVLRKKRGSTGNLYYLEDVVKQETLSTD